MAVDTAEDITSAFAHAWNRGDATALAQLFGDDADFVNVVGLWWRNRQEIRQAHDYGFRKIFAGSHMEFDHVTVRRLGCDAAVVIGSWTLSGQAAAEGVAVTQPRRGVFTFVLERGASGVWTAVSAHNTDRVPGTETNLSSAQGVQPVSYQDT